MMNLLSLSLLSFMLLHVAIATQYQKTTPQRFTVPEGKLGDIIFSSIPLALRLGSGAFVDGWSVSLQRLTY